MNQLAITLRRDVNRCGPVVQDQDGDIDLDEIAEYVEKKVVQQRKMQYMKGALIGVSVFTLILLAANMGLTYAVVELTKET